MWHMPGLLFLPVPPYGTHATLYIELHAHRINGRTCLICDGTQKHDRGELMKQENAVGSQNRPHEHGTEPLQKWYFMLQTYAHTLAAHSQLNSHSPPKYMELPIQLLDDNWFLHLCSHIVILVY